MWLVEAKDVVKAVEEVIEKVVALTPVVVTPVEVKVLNVRSALNLIMMLQSAGTCIILIPLCKMLHEVTLQHRPGHQSLTLTCVLLLT
jgi:hypothetical protein